MLNAIAISLSGGHIEYLKYMFDLLKQKNASHIKIFAGGGGTILPKEIEDLHNYGITRVYHPDDGRKMGLQGMINDLVKKSDFPIGKNVKSCVSDLRIFSISRLISGVENFSSLCKKELTLIKKVMRPNVPVLGITGTGGAGKSSLIDELIRRFLNDFDNIKIGIICVDPSKRKSGGALLGDRIRMNSASDSRIYMRSLATRQANSPAHVNDAISILKASNFDLIILETSGIGQSDTEILDHSDLSLYVMTPEYGAATQLEKIDMLDFADVIAINKFDRRGALDALRDVKKQYQRNNKLFDKTIDEMPVFGTIASQFNDSGTSCLFKDIVNRLTDQKLFRFSKSNLKIPLNEKICIIPQNRIRYLSEISEENRKYNKWVEKQQKIASSIYNLESSINYFDKKNDKDIIKKIKLKDY